MHWVGRKKVSPGDKPVGDKVVSGPQGCQSRLCGWTCHFGAAEWRQTAASRLLFTRMAKGRLKPAAGRHALQQPAASSPAAAVQARERTHIAEVDRLSQVAQGAADLHADLAADVAQNAEVAHDDQETRSTADLTADLGATWHRTLMRHLRLRMRLGGLLTRPLRGQ